jgi:hypothetical protein
MTYDIKFEPETAGVLITIEGPLTGAALFKINAEMYSGKKLPQQRYQIWDCTKSESINVSTDEIRKIAFQDRDASEKNPDQVVALVASKNYFHGIDRIYHVYAEVWTGFESKTFLTLAEAREWVEERIRGLED